jgi:lipopolysaccharide assembly protein B
VEIDLAWLLVLPMLFALGWVTARYDRRQQRRENRGVSRDVLNGLSDVLANDLEAATESLLSAARLAPDATELHRSVGNLYRRRGLIDRAIEVHEGALRHPEISVQDDARLRLDLGRDYLAAGLFDRAVTAFETALEKAVVPGTVSESANQARALLLQTAQRTRDWSSALHWAQELHNHGGSFGEHSYSQLMGHFYCEQAQAALRAGKQDEAMAFVTKAESFSATGPQKRAAQIRAAISQGSSAVAQGAPTPSSCRVCGFRSRQTHWQCPGCHHWDSFLEITS